MLYEKIQIGKPYSPAKRIGLGKQVVYKVEMSCGGGMGGSHWFEYGEIKGDIKTDNIVTLVDAYTKEEKILNRNFIVSIKKVNFITYTWDITEWANYNGKTCNKKTAVLLYAIPLSMEWENSNSMYDSKVDDKYLVDRILLTE